MLLLWGNISDKFKPIFQSLSDVATGDPLLPENEGKKFSHKDGWGFLNVNKEKIVLSKYSTQLTRETNLPAIFDGILMIHARAAAPGEGAGVLNNHPFHAADDRYDVYLAHNGWFDKYKINEMLGYGHPELINDSEIFLKFVMSLEGDMNARMKKALEISKENGYIKGGANIFVIAINRENLNISVFYHSDVAAGKEFKEYNKLYYIKDERFEGVVSSSVILSMHFPKDLEITQIIRGKLYNIEL